MTDEMIKWASWDNADKYNPSKCDLDLEEACRASFVDGIQWFKKSLWHDVDEMPKKAKAFIFECGDNSMNYHIGMMFNPNDYKKNAEIWHMNRWCYLSDILPKEGGEE